MRKILLSGASIAALSLSLVSAANAQSMGDVYGDGTWYVSLFGGVSFANSAKTRATVTTATGTFTTGTASVTQRFKDGYSVGIAAGKQLTDMFRAEVELSYTKVKNKNLTIATTATSTTSGIGGDTSALYVLGNVWADLDIGQKFTPYVGGGLGVAFMKNKISTTSGSLSDKSQGFAFQLGAGVKYPVSDVMDIEIGYRYKSVLNPDYSFAGGALKFNNQDFATHSVFAGLTYRFGVP